MIALPSDVDPAGARCVDGGTDARAAEPAGSNRYMHRWKSLEAAIQTSKQTLKLAPVGITDNMVDKLKSHQHNHESNDVGGSMLDSILRKLCSGHNGNRCFAEPTCSP